MSVHSAATAWRDAASILAIVLVSGLWGLGDSPLAHTEVHRAVTAHQMVQSGRWVVPRLYGQVYLRKPPLCYWAMAAAETLSGRANEWVWRLPSLISAAALAAFLCAMSDRWFGRPAGLAAGVAFLALLALWAESRSAQIDAMNTAASAVCACAIIEIGFGPRKSTWPWGVLCALSFGAALLLKGPAGMPIIVGAMVGAAALNRTWRPLNRPAAWLGLIGGAAIFGLWTLAARMELRAAGIVDMSGVHEMAGRLALPSLGKALEALAMPLQLPLYALPVSLYLIPALAPSLGDPKARERVRALVGAFLVSLVVCGLAMLRNPRYGYPVLPVLCPVAGAVIGAWVTGRMASKAAGYVRAVYLATPGLLIIAQFALAAKAWSSQTPRAALIGITALALIAAGWSMWEGVLGRLRRSAWALVALLTCLSVTFSAYKNHYRLERSHKPVGLQVRRIVGPDATIAADHVVRDFPGVIYYADVQVQRCSEGISRCLKRQAEAGWALLTDAEWQALASCERRRFTRVSEIDRRGKRYVVGWYGGRPQPE